VAEADWAGFEFAFLLLLFLLVLQTLFSLFF
jgi:hypothetical protein